MTLVARITALAAAVRDKLNTMTPRLLPSGGAAGQVLAKSGAADYAVGWVAPTGGGSDPWLRAVLAAPLSSLSAALADGPKLSNIPAGTYLVRGQYTMRIKSATADAKVALTATGHSELHWSPQSVATSTAAFASGAAAQVLVSTVPHVGVGFFAGRAVFTATGTLALQFAQNTATAGAGNETELLAGAMVEALKVG